MPNWGPTLRRTYDVAEVSKPVLILSLLGQEVWGSGFVVHEVTDAVHFEVGAPSGEGTGPAKISS